MKKKLILLLLVCFSLASAEQLVLTPLESRPTVRGNAENFSGSVLVDFLFRPGEQTRASGAVVTFEPGARTNWHSHPNGQTMIVTSGMGWIQAWGEERLTVKPGDVVWSPPNVKHWHGATSTHCLSHLVVQESQDGSPVKWMEPVSDQQYTERG